MHAQLFRYLRIRPIVVLDQTHSLELKFSRKPCLPDLKVLFLGDAGLERYTAGLGTMMVTPVTIEAVVARVVTMLDGSGV